jgi:hypothetical protein
MSGAGYYGACRLCHQFASPLAGNGRAGWRQAPYRSRLLIVFAHG